MKTGNLLSGLPPAAVEESFEELAAAGACRVERIVSRGHASPEGFWYDQSQDEWVVVLQGAAVLELRDPAERLELGVGDWVWIEARRRHRVVRTATDGPTIWLAVHLPPAP